MAFTSRVAKPLLWGAAGATAAYLWDPDRGRARRARLRDQAAARLHRARRDAERKLTYARSTAEGKLEELRYSGVVTAEVDDATLADRVRSEVLGDRQLEGQDVLLDASDGVITLRGELTEPSLASRLEQAVGKVPGVRGVENLIHAPETPAPNKEEALEASAKAERSG